MFKKQTIKKKILFLIFIIVSFSLACYTSVSIYYTEKSAKVVIDAMLLSVAYGSQNIVGDTYHDAIEDSTSINQQDYKKIQDALIEFAHNTKVKEVYSYINFNGELRWTSGSLPTDKFFDKYEDDPQIVQNIYFKPFRDKKVEYFDYSDVYGSVRSVFIPFTTQNGKIYIVGADYSLSEVEKVSSYILIINILFGSFILIIASALAYIFVNQISKPIRSLVSFTNELITNEFQLSEKSQYKLDIFSSSYKDEVGKLSGAFLSMQISLKKYIVDLRDTTIAKESMEGQLRIATAIQMGMIPKEYPAFPDQSEFNICGFMHPAKEVGGDLYNYFMINEDLLGFTIGDVSGKGIAAALFMAMTNTLIKAIASSGLSPAEVLYKANHELYKENDQCMFVTLFFGILNIKTGEVEYANAGHNPFILIQDANGSEYKKISPGMVLAAFENTQFINERVILKQNDTIFMYTDGITEAMDWDQKLFGEVSLLEIIKKSGSLALPELIDDTIKGVASFVNGSEQSDDITVLALRFLASDNTLLQN